MKRDFIFGYSLVRVEMSPGASMVTVTVWVLPDEPPIIMNREQPEPLPAKTYALDAMIFLMKAFATPEELRAEVRAATKDDPEAMVTVERAAEFVQKYEDELGEAAPEVVRMAREEGIEFSWN